MILPRRIPQQRQSGFTLLELIVALAISSLVAMLGAAAMSTALDFYNRNSGRATAREDIRAAERTLRHEWATRGALIRSDGNTLEFDTLHAVAPHTFKAQTLARVTYTCDKTSSLDMRLTHRVFIPAANGQAAATTATPESKKASETTVLASKLQVCSFSFLARVADAQGNVQPKWVNNWNDNNPAPQLMRMTLSGLRADMPPVVYQARTSVGQR